MGRAPLCGVLGRAWTSQDVRKTENGKKKQNEKRPKTPIEIVVFKLSSKNEKMKKWIFSKNCLTLFVSGRQKTNAHFRAHYLFWANNFLTKTVKTRKSSKINGFSGNCPKPKMTPFLKKVLFFDMGEKVGFTSCVLEKLCSSENTMLIVFSAKHSSCNKKTLCWITDNLWKIVGCFWTWRKGVFVCFFSGF